MKNVQIQIRKCVTDLYREVLFNGRGSARTIRPTSAVKINIPAAAVKITRDLQRHLFSFVAQSHMLSRTSATDKSISKSISMEIMNFLPIFVFNTLTPGAYPYLWYKL